MRSPHPVTFLLTVVLLSGSTPFQAEHRTRAAGPASEPLALLDQGIRFPDGTLLTSAVRSYSGVVIVAKSGGHQTSIQAALATITNASESNRYLILVGPGTYAEQVRMKEWVDIQGSGEGVTTIHFDGFDYAAVYGADNAELRFLTVSAVGDYQLGMSAILNDSASPKLSHLTLTTVGGDEAVGVLNFDSSPAMTDLTISARWGYWGGTGVYNLSSSPTMNNVTITATGTDPEYDWMTGVYNRRSSPTMTNVKITAEGGARTWGIENFASAPRMVGVTVRARNAIDANYGLTSYYYAAYPQPGGGGTGSDPDIRDSRIEASGGTEAVAIKVDLQSRARVATSQVIGKIRGSPANCLCFGTYDAGFAPLGVNCR